MPKIIKEIIMTFHDVYLYIYRRGWRRHQVPTKESVDKLIETTTLLSEQNEKLMSELSSVSSVIEGIQFRIDDLEDLLPEFTEPDPETPDQDPLPEPEGLRWVKADQGEPITWCFDTDNSPFSGNQLEGELQSIFNKIETFSSIRFEQVDTPDCDIRTFFEEIDSDGGTLAFVFLPNQGDLIEACTPQCGDIHFDQDDVDNVDMVGVHDILAHEICHSCGLDHVTTEASIMNPIFTPSGSRVDLGEDAYVVREFQRRYPI